MNDNDCPRGTLGHQARSQRALITCCALATLGLLLLVVGLLIALLLGARR
jgi:hypothetical protein